MLQFVMNVVKFKGKKKVIKMFSSLDEGGIISLGRQTFSSSYFKESKLFFENIIKLEETFDARTEVILVSKMNDLNALYWFKTLKESFKEEGMGNRLSGVLFDGEEEVNGYDAAGKGIKLGCCNHKYEKVATYADKFDKTKYNTVLSIYAGETAGDRDMYYSQLKGNCYSGVPCHFINTHPDYRDMSDKDVKKLVPFSLREFNAGLAELIKTKGTNIAGYFKSF